MIFDRDIDEKDEEMQIEDLELLQQNLKTFSIMCMTPWGKLILTLWKTQGLPMLVLLTPS